MTDFRPRPPRKSPGEARLDELTVLRRELTDEEQREVMWLSNRVRKAAQRREKYAKDEAYRESLKAKSRQWWRDNYGYTVLGQ